MDWEIVSEADEALVAKVGKDEFTDLALGDAFVTKFKDRGRRRIIGRLLRERIILFAVSRCGGYSFSVGPFFAEDNGWEYSAV